MEEYVSTLIALLEEFDDDAPINVVVEGSNAKWEISVLPDDVVPDGVCLYLSPSWE